LIEENRSLKREFESQAAEIEELKERVDTLKYLEEEASEENEILRFKVLSLEGGGGCQDEMIKLVDELKVSKREIKSENEVLKTQVKAFKMIIGKEEDTQGEEETEERKSSA